MQRLTITGLLFSTATLIACSDSPTPPSEPRLEGTYTATAFTVMTPDTVFDLLAEGVSLTLTLNPDRTTTGTQISSEVVTDLRGEWDTTADTLRLQLATPSLLTRTAFVVSPNRLQGDPRTEGFAFHLTLTK